MAKVYHKVKVTRCQFRKLPKAAVYWLNTNTAVAPSIKVAARAKAGALSTDKITQTAVADVSVSCVRVPPGFLRG